MKKKLKLDLKITIIIVVSAIWLVVFLIMYSVMNAREAKIINVLDDNSNRNTAESYQPVYLHSMIMIAETQTYALRVANALGIVPEETRNLLEGYGEAVSELYADAIFLQNTEFLEDFEAGINCLIRAMALMLGEMEDEVNTVEDYFDGAEAYFNRASNSIGVDYYSVPQFIPQEKITTEFSVVYSNYLQQLVDVCDALRAELLLLNFNDQQSFLISSIGFLKKLIYNRVNIQITWAYEDEVYAEEYAKLCEQYDSLIDSLSIPFLEQTWLTPEAYYTYSYFILQDTIGVVNSADEEYGIYPTENVMELLDGTYYRDKYGVWRKGEGNTLFVKEEDGSYRKAEDADYSSGEKLFIKREDGTYDETTLDGIKEYQYNGEHYEGDGHNH